MNKNCPNGKSKKWSWKRKRIKPFAFYKDYDNKIHVEEGTMAKFWELLEQSVIFQGMITIALILTTCFLWITGREVPGELWTANTFVLAFFFGAKTQQTIHKRIK